MESCNYIVNESKEVLNTLYQVFNGSGYPAGNDSNPLAVFATAGQAKEWINYLHFEVGLPDALECEIREIKIS